ncbi:MAG: YdcF family protein [Myxococcota bacterium]
MIRYWHGALLGVLLGSLLLGGAAGCAAAILPETRPLRSADAIVVLGNRPPVQDGAIAPELRRRVEAGVALYQRGLAPLLVFTGGPAGEHVEADIAARHALALGVPESAIRLERHSQDTIGNVTGAMTILCEGGRCRPAIIVVSSPYHLQRAKWLFECAGAETQLSGTEIPDDGTYRTGFVIREYFVRIYYLFIDYCARAAGDPAPENYSDILR